MKLLGSKLTRQLPWLLAVLGAVGAPPAHAATLPAGFTEALVASS